MTSEGIGAPVRRVEDRRFLLGQGRFVADIHVPGELRAVVLRSPHAHATIDDIDSGRAGTMPGVVAIFTGADMAADRVGPMRSLWAVKSADGTPMAEPPRWPLARGRVRHFGEPVALVVAETETQALDAAELVDVAYTALPCLADTEGARAADAPQIHPEAPGNRVFHWVRGDADAVRKNFAASAHRVSLDLVNNRLICAALETRAVIASPDLVTGRITLWSASQIPHLLRRQVAEALGITESELRVICPDVGGGFGTKGKLYPEEVTIAWAARRLGRPVKWIASRSEAFAADYHARDHRTHAELALDAEGHFLAIRVSTFANLGAYVSNFGASIPSAIYAALLAGGYRTPAIAVESIGIFTNTVPTEAYRGAGRPEACYVLERLADRAARKLCLDAAEIRRRNLIPRAAMPYKTPIGPVYDSGDFPKMLERALTLADYAGFASRRAAAGNRRGIGMACYVESSGVAPSRFAGMLGARVGFFESAAIRVAPDGAVRAALGTHSHGQGHATTMAQILSERLGVSLAQVEIVEGDTDLVPVGTGTFGSRSIAVGGSALDRAAMKIIAKGKRIAAHLLEASVDDLSFSGGSFRVTGTDRHISFAEIAHAAYVPHNYPLETLEPGLEETAFYDPTNFAFSNGVHLCEVEVDIETGVIRVLGYYAADDIGTVINPMIVEGQIHGVAQGLGQGMLEACRYDSSGQLLSGSFMDYAVPRADDLPFIASLCDEGQPCTHNPLGAKGCGEAGAIGAPAALVGAVLDALHPLGVEDIEMPLTPERVWRAIRAAG